MFTPVRGRKTGSWALPAVVLLAMAGFFMPVIHIWAVAPFPASGSGIAWDSGIVDPSVALPAHSVDAPTSLLEALPRVGRVKERRGHPHYTVTGAWSRPVPVLHPVQADGGRSASGLAGAERRALTGRLASPATAPPLLRTPGA
ncbi:MAG TPA: hypothetical protein VLA43_02370 [Longimicrobiales bacterium]|nr:hypothetical protein [Longimicrobiales bacterium]